MITIKTKERIEIVDITEDVQSLVSKSDVKDGIAIVYTPHTTTAIIINEAERGLMDDITSIIQKIVPQNSYKHDRIDNNADAHLRAVILGNSVVVPVTNGKLDLGTWQRIMFVELDGPRSRRVLVKVVK
ncbi:MAG TPA: YjbQ family protein [Archaeoglobus veneficus]|nr:YjbQ family protein [Archaeoglobus veneficus]